MAKKGMKLPPLPAVPPKKKGAKKGARKPKLGY